MECMSFVVSMNRFLQHRNKEFTLLHSELLSSNSKKYQGTCRVACSIKSNLIQAHVTSSKATIHPLCSPIRFFALPLPNYSSPGSSTTKSTLTLCIPKSSSLTAPGTAAREMAAASSTMSLATFIPIRALVSIVEMKLSMPDV